MERSGLRSMISVTLETSALGVRDGRVRGVRWCFSPRAFYGNRCCSYVEGPEFGFRNVCEGGAAGVVEMSRHFLCVFVRLVDVFVQVVDVFVQVVDVFVVLSVEPVERSRDCVTCWYGEKSGEV